LWTIYGVPQPDKASYVAHATIILTCLGVCAMHGACTVVEKAV